ncbi:MAG: hypothetical protein M3437_16070 [Chloroflexota bacterium]|nr:hypothetical protein [Chloroflexota bacterium]MDQ5867804.1 hypothetical protein [Chloroflexota bacterium]
MSSNKNHHDIELDADLVHEVLEQLGWRGDAEALVNRINRLSLGIPAEDEFTALLSWLGRCVLVHKLDGFQSPPASRMQYKVPDLLAIFEYKGRRIHVLIEVKVKQARSLKWRPDYYEGLARYSEQLGIPLLIAWKTLGRWALFEIGHFKRPQENYVLSFQTAFKESLMSILAGDFAFVPCAGVGLHLHIRKLEVLGETVTDSGLQQEWMGVIEDVYFTNGNRDRVTKLSPGLWPLLLSCDQVEQVDIKDAEFVQSFVVEEEEPMQHAHVAFTILTYLKNEHEQTLRWRQLLRAYNLPTEAPILRKAATDGIKKGFIRYVFDIVPNTRPAFLAVSD